MKTEAVITAYFQPSTLNIQPNIARALGFEPRSKVLETRMLPLHHARMPPQAPPGRGLKEYKYLKNFLSKKAKYLSLRPKYFVKI